MNAFMFRGAEITGGLRQKIGNLFAIKDHYPKFVITLDDFAGGNVIGVNIVHLVDFLFM